MINFDFHKPTEKNPEGTISIFLHEKSKKFFSKNQLPLYVIHKSINGRVFWKSELYLNHYSNCFFNSNTTVEIIDNQGNNISTWKWDCFQHGDLSHQLFKIWSQNNKKSHGIVIGSHNGTSGEWVEPVISGEIEAVIVEPSDKQFIELSKLYGELPWVELKKEVITSDGRDVNFYEGSDGFTNSLNKEITEKHNKGNIIKKYFKSKSINDLIIESSDEKKVKWIHMDVEGSDGELVYAIRDELLPELLIFESLHMSDDYKERIKFYLTSKGYSVQHSGWNTICLKN